MTTMHDLNSLKKQSRIAALSYFVNGLPAPFALLYVPSVLIVRGDAAATANNIRDSEALLGPGMAGQLFTATIAIFAMLAFYHLFKAVTQKHAMFALLWFKSRYIPRSLATLGIFSAAVAGIVIVATMIFPTLARVTTVVYYGPPGLIFEVGLGLWLIIKGIQAPTLDPATR
jgi:Domain of unknown function (DUF4386)